MDFVLAVFIKGAFRFMGLGPLSVFTLDLPLIRNETGGHHGNYGHHGDFEE